jgi:hypothetical protein
MIVVNEVLAVSPPPASEASGGEGLGVGGRFGTELAPPTRLGAPHLATLPAASRGEGICSRCCDSISGP